MTSSQVLSGIIPSYGQEKGGSLIVCRGCWQEYRSSGHHDPGMCMSCARSRHNQLRCPSTMTMMRVSPLNNLTSSGSGETITPSSAYTLSNLSQDLVLLSRSKFQSASTACCKELLSGDFKKYEQPHSRMNWCPAAIHALAIVSHKHADCMPKYVPILQREYVSYEGLRPGWEKLVIYAEPMSGSGQPYSYSPYAAGSTFCVKGCVKLSVPENKLSQVLALDETIKCYPSGDVECRSSFIGGVILLLCAVKAVVQDNYLFPAKELEHVRRSLKKEQRQVFNAYHEEFKNRDHSRSPYRVGNVEVQKFPQTLLWEKYLFNGSSYLFEY